MRVYETVAGAGAKVQVAGRRAAKATGGLGDHLDRDHRAGGAGRGPAAGRCVGVPDRQPAGPAARALRPVLAGARRRAGPTGGGRARGRRRRLRRRAGGQAAGGAGRRRRTRTANGAGGRRERAVRGADPGRPGVPAGGAGRRTGRRRGAGAAGPPLPQRRRPRHPGVAGTARGADAAPRWNSRAANLFRDRRAREAAPTVSRRVSARVVLLDRTGAVLLFCGSDPALPDGRTALRRAGGSPSEARRNRARRWPRPRCANWRRRRGCGSSPPT